MERISCRNVIVLWCWWCWCCRWLRGLESFTGWVLVWWFTRRGGCFRRTFRRGIRRTRSIWISGMGWQWRRTNGRSGGSRERRTVFSSAHSANRRCGFRRDAARSVSPARSAEQNLWKKADKKERFLCLDILISIRKNCRKKIKKSISPITVGFARS